MKSASLLIALLLTGNVLLAQNLTIKDYEKTEVYIKTRDSVALYTAIYHPKDRSRHYPILLTRTPYGCAPYGQEMPDEVMYNDLLVREGYIFVQQDIRGRSMSDGEDMINMKPVYSQKDSNKTDEATDAYDAIDWLVKHIPDNNGNVGIYGNSYRGWTALMGAVSHHPALKAVLAGAPCMDLYFEDFSRYGCFGLGYMPIMDWFGTHKTKREPGAWWTSSKEYFSFFENNMNKRDKDSYEFYLKKGALKNYTSMLSPDNYFWNYLKAHPDYDAARKERSTMQYLKNLDCPIMIVGGWNDEQNMYGTVKSFPAVSMNNKSTTKYIMGPWSHSDYRHSDSTYSVGNIFYGKGINEEYLKKEFAFFQCHLNNRADDGLPNISYFNTGSKEWANYDQLPKTKEHEFYLMPGERLSETQPDKNSMTYVEYLSDPGKPVPYVEQDNYSLFVSRSFMTDDQRFAYKRPDVLTFTTDALTEDLTITGKTDALLKFATDHEDADLIVKLIDVLPMDRQPEATDKPGVKMNGYQQMVRCGYIRGRYRSDFSSPKPFVPSAVTNVHVELLDINHTFRKGHKVMVQIQSSLFPLLDRNPQKYVTNIFEADDNDFEKASHRIYSGSKIVLRELAANK